MQIRIGHIPLNGYLRRIGKVETNECAECRDLQEDHPIVETVTHFIFECPAYHQARQELIETIGRSRFNFVKIMTKTDYLKSLVTYINRTERFKNKE